MKRILSLAAALVFAATVSAHAASYTYVTSTGSVSAKATFAFGVGSLALTLENLTAPTQFIEQELDGFNWSMAPGGALTLNSVTTAAIVNCDGDNTFPCPSGTGTSPFGWGVTGTGTYLLKAGSGFHPYAIINPNYLPPATGNGQLANHSHNPLLIGPVVFNFSFSPTIGEPVPSNVSFLWGTAGTPTTGCLQTAGAAGCGDTTVPEPASMLLLGTGLLGAGFFARKRRK